MKDKVALVTGGTGGIGTAICHHLAKQAYKVATSYQNYDKALLWQQQQQALGYDFYIAPGDVNDFDSCAKMVASITESVGSIAVLVNNAGIARDAQLHKMTAKQWQEVLRTNLDSLFNVTRQVITAMIAQNNGRIINISSINGEKGQFGQTNYSAAKAGVHGFTMALAQEVARKGITVNTISPGYIATEMVMAVPEEVRQKIIAQIPIGRLGQPEEIARVVAFLAAPESAFITGANFAINGGQHMH